MGNHMSIRGRRIIMRGGRWRCFWELCCGSIWWWMVIGRILGIFLVGRVEGSNFYFLVLLCQKARVCGCAFWREDVAVYDLDTNSGIVLFMVTADVM